MKRRHVLQSVLGGLVCVVRLFTYLSEDGSASPHVFVADDTQEPSTLEFTLGSENQAYLLLPFDSPVKLHYIARSKNNTDISISTIKYEGGLDNETAYTRYPGISQQQIESATGSHTIPAGTGEYMLRFENESESGPIPVLDNDSTAEVRYDFRITAV